ncbi:hypothetical protein SLS62_004553 [Diatrype stigma]|uniref:Protein HRI1 n=1 Tax=Diatrype stigma TaxID=117547 RepID=A0AAN9UT15_9PEZI
MGSISIREYIRWLPSPPSENTSTLVLTSPGRRYVDIRMLLPPPGTKTTNEGGSADESDETIEWAFAGTSSSEIRANGIKHSTWRHFVDSRTRDDAEGVVDEADMFPAPPLPSDEGGSGSDRTLEKGRMVNPDTGLETDYEEMWRDVEPVAVPSSGGGGGGDKIRSAVLELRDDAAGRRGLVVCLGRRCQGVVRCGDAFALEQWEWQQQEQGGSGKDEGEGGWKRRRRVGAGDLYLPCQDAVEKVADLDVGGRIERDGVVWTVVEASQ